MKAHIDSQLALGEIVARCAPLPSDGSNVVRPTVVVMSKLRIARPSAMAESTEPPSESSTSLAPRTLLLRANASKARAVSSVMTPVAEIQVRQCAPHCSAGPSMRHSKRIGAGLSSRAADGLLTQQSQGGACQRRGQKAFHAVPFPIPYRDLVRGLRLSPARRLHAALQGKIRATCLAFIIRDASPV